MSALRANKSLISLMLMTDKYSNVSSKCIWIKTGIQFDNYLGVWILKYEQYFTMC